MINDYSVACQGGTRNNEPAKQVLTGPSFGIEDFSLLAWLDGRVAASGEERPEGIALVTESSLSLNAFAPLDVAILPVASSPCVPGVLP